MMAAGQRMIEMELPGPVVRLLAVIFEPHLERLHRWSLALLLCATAVAAYAGPPKAKTAPVTPDTPVAAITGWTFSVDSDANDIKKGTRVELSPAQSDIIFFFDTTPLSNSRYLPEIVFRYRLSGYDSEWTSTLSRQARYRRLPPGKYQFEVQARKGGE